MYNPSQPGLPLSGIEQLRLCTLALTDGTQMPAFCQLNLQYVDTNGDGVPDTLHVITVVTLPQN